VIEPWCPGACPLDDELSARSTSSTIFLSPSPSRATGVFAAGSPLIPLPAVHPCAYGERSITPGERLATRPCPGHVGAKPGMKPGRFYTVTLRNNTTVTSNHANPTPGSGGGIFVAAGTVTLESGSSVTGNTPDNYAGTVC
jgi:putative cofactor-binding repeat protein